MASASVTGLGDCREFDASGSLGRFRANGPIAAHPPLRMRPMPPRVVLAEVRMFKQTPQLGTCSGQNVPDPCGHAGWIILPRSWSFVYGGSHAGGNRPRLTDVEIAEGRYSEKPQADSLAGRP